MRVTIARTGGFAGLRRSWEADTTAVPGLTALVDACPWERPQPPVSGADRFVYEITAGDCSATIHEPHATGPWKQLIDRVVRLHDYP